MLLREVLRQPDATGRDAVLCVVADPHSRAARDVVFRLGERHMQTRIGTTPLAKGPDAKGRRRAFGKGLKASVSELSAAYCCPNVDAGCYAKDDHLMGYVLKYSLYNAYVLAAVLEHYRVVELLGCGEGSVDPVEAVSVGGGPLTDWLGLRLHHRSDPECPPFRCTVYDLPMWAPLWAHVTELEGLPDPPVEFLPQDVCDVPRNRLPVTVGDRPVLLLFMYVICELEPHAGSFTEVFCNLLQSVPAGSIAVIVERMRHSARSYVQALLARLADTVEVLLDGERLWVELPTPTVLEVTRFVRKFGLKPRTAGPACVTLLRTRPKG